MSKKEVTYDNVKDMVLGLYDEYKTEYMQIFAEENGVKDLDEINEEDIYSMICEDLDDKEFTEEEIEEITSREMKEETLYKLGAYMILLYAQPDDYDEWKSIITDELDAALSKKDMKKLWKATDKVCF